MEKIDHFLAVWKKRVFRSTAHWFGWWSSPSVVVVDVVVVRTPRRRDEPVRSFSSFDRFARVRSFGLRVFVRAFGLFSYR